MTIFARSRSWLAGAARDNNLLRLAVPLAALLALAVLASPAGALVVKVGGTEVGVQTRYAPAPGERLGEGEPLKFGNKAGNAVVHGASVYAVYWDPGNEAEEEFQEPIFHHEWLTKVNQFLQDLGSASGSLATIFAADSQYRDRTNAGASHQTVFKGNYSDTAKYPSAGCTDPNPLLFGQVTCLTDAQLRAQLQAFISAHKLPTGMGTIYYLLTPPGVTVCLDEAATHCSDYTASAGEEAAWAHESTSFEHSFCSYHGDINPDAASQGDGNTILYAAIPWTAGYQGDATQLAPSMYFERGYTCQDGGWSPAGNEEKFEEPKAPSEEEEKILKGEKGSSAEKAALERRRELERPHNEEPNQEGKSEFGDYGAGLADLLINQIAVEQADITTDPLLSSWQDPTHHEVTDLCHDTFAGTAGQGVEGSLVADEHTEAGTLSNQTYGKGQYYINNTFSLSNHGCVGGVGLVPRFTSPNPVNTGEIVGFNGMESTALLQEGLAFGPSGPPTKTYMTFSWNFGDGTPEVSGFAPGAPICEAPWLSPCAASSFHSYAYGGTYKVTLTVTDVGGNAAAVEHEVTVNGPPPPAPAPSPGTTPPGPGTTPPGSGGGSKGPGASSAAGPPSVRASILSRSLKSVTHKGLVISYSVNEQVAGHFEVLLSKSLAHRLGLPGVPATGLPAGTGPQVLIGKAVLVTTKAGKGKVTIVLSKAVAKHLRKAHSLGLMLRLTVRNAASAGAQTVSSISSSRLH